MTATNEANILDRLKLEQYCIESRKNSKKVVLTLGGFDLLHIGHLKFLEASRKHGDVLIIGITDDGYVTRTKGDNRPIQNEYDRAYLIAGFECVSRVHIFTDTMDIIELTKPDVFIMSTTSARSPEDRMEHQEKVRKYGGDIAIFDAFSTTHASSIIDSMIPK